MPVTSDDMSNLKPGDRLKLFYNPGNISNKVFHIVGWLKDGEDTVLVTKQWLSHKRRWWYECNAMELTSVFWDYLTVLKL